MQWLFGRTEILALQRGRPSLQWLPKNVWFSHDSAYPKQNMFERQVQLISCAGDKSVLIWSLRKPSSDDDELMDDHDQMHEQQAKGRSCPTF